MLVRYLFILSDRWRVRKEKLWMAFVWRLPRRLVYWCVIRCFAHGTTGVYGGTHPSSLTFDTLLDRWEGRE